MARLGANAKSEDEVDAIECNWAGVESKPCEAAALQRNEEGAAACVLEERSRAPPECFALPPARDGENNLTFAKASVMFSLSIAPMFIVNLKLERRTR